ncbi:Polysaccharide biosynthesis protein [Rhodobacteraceae bacterium SB2]|nr:Polysaccharide biosynthesis protein [Rhodobacteraceae bacterium SB2]
MISAENSLQKFSTDVVLYGFGIIIAKGISFFLYPIFAYFLSVEEFGRLDLVLITIAFVGEVLIFGLDSVLSIKYFKQKTFEEKASVVLTTYFLRSFLIVTALSITFLLYLSLGDLLPFVKEYDKVLTISALVIVAQHVFVMANEINRLEQKPKSYVFYSFIYSSVFASVSATGVAFFNFGVVQILISSVIAYLVAGGSAWINNRRYLLCGEIDYGKLLGLLKVGFPLCLAGLSYYFMEGADRWFISWITNLNEVGKFALACKLSLVIGVGVEAFRKSAFPFLSLAAEQRDQRSIRLIRIVYIIAGTFFVFLVSSILFAQYPRFLPVDYSVSWLLLFFLCLNKILYGNYMLTSFGLMRAEKAVSMMKISVFCAIFCVIANYISIPVMGIEGAAASTCLTFLLLNILSDIGSNRVDKTHSVRYFDYAFLISSIVAGLLFVSYA